MKVLLISLHKDDVELHKKAPTDISGLGARYIASALKRHNIGAKILFLRKPFEEVELNDELDQIRSLVSSLSPDMIGLSLMSNHLRRAIHITQYLKKHFSIPIVWGGVHPTLQPEDSLKYADIVCAGEGEEAFPELLEKMERNVDYFSTESFWFKKGEQIVRNQYRVLQDNLDTLPYPDYDLSDHYIIHQGELVPLTMSIYRQYFPGYAGHHRIMTSRGCPYSCSFCYNSAFRELYKGHYLRRRSPENVIREMEEAKKQFPFLVEFKIMDDTFLMGNQAWIDEFTQKYKERINLPFYCLISPNYITREKVAQLVDARLVLAHMGLQSGSERVNRDIYNRKVKNSKFLEAVNLLSEFHPKLKQMTIDVICDNPYETEEDVIETINILSQVPKPFGLAMYSLTLYPHTGIYNRALEDGIISPDDEKWLTDAFHTINPTYLNKLMRLTPILPKKRIQWFVEHRSSLVGKLLVDLIYYSYIHRDKIPLEWKNFMKRVVGQKWYSCSTAKA